MNDRAMYEVWYSYGDGTKQGPRFRRLEDALRYVNAHDGEASFAIKGPVGYWYQWSDTGKFVRERNP